MCVSRIKECLGMGEFLQPGVSCSILSVVTRGPSSIKVPHHVCDNLSFNETFLKDHTKDIA